MHTSENKYPINTQLFPIPNSHIQKFWHAQGRQSAVFITEESRGRIWHAINIPSSDHLFWVSTVSSSDLWAGSDFLWPCWSLVASQRGYLCRKCLWWSSREPRCRPWTRASRRMPCASEPTISSGGASYFEVLAFWTSVPTAWRRNMKILMSGEDEFDCKIGIIWEWFFQITLESFTNDYQITHESLSNQSQIPHESRLTLKSLTNHSRITHESHSNPSRITHESLWNHSGITLESISNHSRITLESLSMPWYINKYWVSR